jgi:thiamine biosynthesis lipoprotein
MYHEHRFRSMNTDVGAWLWHAEADVAASALRDVEQFFQAAHTRFTRFDPQSELSALNASSGHAFAASPQLYEVVELAVKYSALTGGLFNPTIIGALEAAGYDRTFEAVQARSELPEDQSSSIKSMSQIKFDRVQRTITLPMGVRIDLGGIAKGWAVQQAAQQLAQYGPCLVDAGGDMRTIGLVPGTTHWSIDVVDPFDRERDVLTLRLRDQSVATSGVDRRKWQRRDGMWQHHLIDPRTGHPSDSDVLTATVIAPTTVEAEVYAKTVFLLGSEAGLRFIDERPALAACVVLSNGEAIMSQAMQGYLDVHFTYSSSPMI